MVNPPESIDYQLLAAQAPVAWSVVDLEGRQVAGNDVYAGLFGYDLDDIASLTVRDLTHPDDLGHTEDYLSQLVSGEIDRYQTDKRYVRKDGSEFTGHLVASLLRAADGTPQGLVGVITDVTEARALARFVALNEERLSKMLTNISDTVTLVGADGRVLAWTGRHIEVLGYRQAFWQDRSIFGIVHPDEQSRAEAVADEVLASPGVEVTAEFRIRHHDGHYEDIELAAVNLLDDPAVGAVVLTSRNITARRVGERELLQMRDRAMALARHRGEFVAQVSHELRTPLHGVLGLSELLHATELSEEQGDLVEAIRSTAGHLRKTVDDLLDFTRIEAEGITLEPVPVDLRRLVARVVELNAATGYRAGVPIRSVVDDAVPPVVTLDPHRFEQILTNLVGNAAKFTPEGEVLIRVSRTSAGVEVAVLDTGPGIPIEFRDVVFQPFGQVPGVSSSVKGTGLGLAVVRGLVELMGGSISVEDRDGGGSCFRVRLPLVETVQTPATHQGSRLEPTRRARVLVVEDDEVNQLLVRGQLERLGHEFDIATSGRAALDHLARPDHGYDLVLMDWRLPDLDGLEVTRRLRRIEADRASHVPVVAATASAMPEDRAACRAAGMDDFMSKPVGLDDLAAVVAKWTARTLTRGQTSSNSTVDDRRLATLGADLGDAGVLVALLGTFLDELGRVERSLVDAAARRDLAAIHRIGHTLRSTSEMVGASSMAAECERLAAVTETDQLVPLVERFGRVAAATRRELACRVEQGGAS